MFFNYYGTKIIICFGVHKFENTFYLGSVIEGTYKPIGDSIFAIGIVVLVARFNDPILLFLFFLLVVFH